MTQQENNLRSSRIKKLLASAVDIIVGRSAEAAYRGYCEAQPSEQLGHIKIVGNFLFRHVVSSALDVLAESDRYGYRLVQRYVRAIVATENTQGLGYLIGVRFEKVDSSGEIRWRPQTLAAILVRYAVWIRLYRGYCIRPRSSLRTQALALRRELACMQLTRASSKDINSVQTYLDRISDAQRTKRQ